MPVRHFQKLEEICTQLIRDKEALSKIKGCLDVKEVKKADLVVTSKEKLSISKADKNALQNILLRAQSSKKYLNDFNMHYGQKISEGKRFF